MPRRALLRRAKGEPIGAATAKFAPKGAKLAARGLSERPRKLVCGEATAVAVTLTQTDQKGASHDWQIW